MADARHNDAVGAAELAGNGRRPDLCADRGEGLAHRCQVAGAVIDERDHSRPLVLGSMLREALVFRARHAQCARERLETGFDLVMVGTSVEHLQMDVGARGVGKALEEVVHELGLQIAHHAAP